MARDRPWRWKSAAALLLVLAAGAGTPLSPVAADDASGTAAPAWAFNPADPGPDRPAVGRSLFDQVFADERNGTAVIGVPYPFEALRRQLLSSLGSENGESAAVAQVLIPLGRALQRNAAAPDYFASPRLVLAVVGDPRQLQEDGTPRALGARLKDRLYIGYQEKAESLEVISYNEAAGRFEFQVVEDYAQGRAPRVVYARRPVCLACHQNCGPIFSEPPWSETNANAEIARQLAEEAPAFHGMAAQDGSRPFDQASAISGAVERANSYPASQRIWRDGCGDTPSKHRCRAGLLTAALQFKLSAKRHFDRRSGRFDDEVAAPLRQAWAELWPAGLAIPDPFVPNRDPLAEGFEVAAETDPLLARAPLEVWQGLAPGVEQEAVEGLAQLLPAADAARLDRRLRASAGHAPHSSQRTLCALSHRDLEGVGERFLFRCASHEPGGPMLDGHFYLRPQGRLEGGISWLTLGGSGGEDVRFEDLAITAECSAARIAGDGPSRVAFRARDRRSGLTPRLPDGTALQGIALAWDGMAVDAADPSAEIPDHPPNGEAELTFAHDFAAVEEAVAGLLRRAEQGAPNILADGTFHGGRAMAAVLAALGVTSHCCEDDRDAPPIALDRPRLEPGPGIYQTFVAFCAACHATDSPYPPNFLHDGTSDGTGIVRCAERIAFRLAMWDRPAGARAKSPMPPESWLRGAGWSPERWRGGAPRATLRDHVATLLAEAGASITQVDDRGRQAYEALPPCLEAAE